MREWRRAMERGHREAVGRPWKVVGRPWEVMGRP